MGEIAEEMTDYPRGGCTYKKGKSYYKSKGEFRILKDNLKLAVEMLEKTYADMGEHCDHSDMFYEIESVIEQIKGEK